MRRWVRKPSDGDLSFRPKWRNLTVGEFASGPHVPAWVITDPIPTLSVMLRHHLPNPVSTRTRWVLTVRSLLHGPKKMGEF
jgi:hypothetical protein